MENYFSSTLQALDGDERGRKRQRFSSSTGTGSSESGSGAWPFKAPLEAIVAALAELSKLKGLYELQLAHAQQQLPLLLTHEATPMRAGAATLGDACACKRVALTKAATLLRARCDASRRTVARNRAFVAELRRLRSKWTLRAGANGGAPEAFVGIERALSRPLVASLASLAPPVLTLEATEHGAAVRSSSSSSSTSSSSGPAVEVAALAVELSVHVRSEVRSKLVMGGGGGKGRDAASASAPLASAAGVELAELQHRNDAALLAAHRTRFAAELWSILARQEQRFSSSPSSSGGEGASASGGAFACARELRVPIAPGVSLQLRLRRLARGGAGVGVDAAAEASASAAEDGGDDGRLARTLSEQATALIWSRFLVRAQSPSSSMDFNSAEGGSSSSRCSLVECVAVWLRHAVAQRGAAHALDALAAAWRGGGGAPSDLTATWVRRADAAHLTASSPPPLAIAAISLGSSGGAGQQLQLGTVQVEGGVWWWATASSGVARRRIEPRDVRALWRAVACRSAAATVQRIAAPEGSSWRAVRSACVVPATRRDFVRAAAAEKSELLAIRVRPVFVEGATAVRTGDEAQVVETSVALRVEWRRGASGAWSEGALDASGQLPSSVFTL